MARKFIFFLNPISGTKNKAALKPLIQKKMCEHAFSFQLFDTIKNGDYRFLPSLIHEQQITDIIICGGDGSVSQVAAHLIPVQVNIGIIPMGSGNGLAYAAGIPKNPARALDIIINGRSAFIDGFFINRQFSCMLSGIGFDAQVAADFAKQKKRGFVTYARQTIKNFFSIQAYPFDIYADGIYLNTEAFFISVANSNQFGNNVTIAPKASLGDGLLDVVIVNKTEKLRMIYSLLRHIKFGRPLQVSEAGNKTAIHYFQTKKLLIKNPSLAPLHVDGEPSQTSNYLEINIIEKAFKLLQPVI